MKKRFYSSILIVVVLALLFVLKVYVSDYFFDAFFGVLACYAGFEMSKLLAKTGRYNYLYVATFFPSLILTANLVGITYTGSTGDIYTILWTILVDVGLMAVVFLFTYLFGFLRRKEVLHEMAVRGVTGMSVNKFGLIKAFNTLITFVYPVFLFLFFIFINHFNILPLGKMEDAKSDVSSFILLTTFIIPMFTDTFAYLMGSLIGGKKLCPKISPNKTISGSVGGILWCVLLSACVYLIFGCISSYEALMSVFPIWAYLIIVLLGSVIAQSGDLFESLIKRKAGVSDSGKFLPGHGGLLDRIDSHIFMAPYILLAFWIALL